MNTDKSKESSYGRVIKYTGIFGGVQGLSIITGILRNKLAAVLLGTAGMGLVSMFNTALSLMSNCTNLGISFSAVRNISEAYEAGNGPKMAYYIRVVRSWSFLTALLGVIACIGFAPLLSYWSFEGHYYYTTSFMLLSPIVGFMAITGGEVAILKGTRHLSKVALYSLLTAIASLFISIPLFYFFGWSGIVPALVLVSLASMLIVVVFSFRYFPYRLSLFSKSVLGKGVGMVKLGVSFIFAGILGSAVELIIRSFLLEASNINTVGLYSCGYALIVTFAGLVFAAIDADFFPRLSSVNSDVARSNVIVNEQIEVTVLLVAPLLVGFLIFLPIILPLFYSKEFTPVIAMTQFAMFSMFTKAMTLPMAYMSLSKGDSITYLLQEFFYDIIIVALVVVGYKMDELRGAGIALGIAGALDWVIVYLITRVRYKFRFSKKGFAMFGLQAPFFFLALALTQLIGGGIFYWGLGLLCCMASGGISLYVLHRQTTVLQTLRQKIKNKFKR